MNIYEHDKNVNCLITKRRKHARSQKANWLQTRIENGDELQFKGEIGSSEMVQLFIVGVKTFVEIVPK